MTPEPDPLSEILEAFPLSIRSAGRFELAAPWGLSVPKQLAAVWAVNSGGCLLRTRGAAAPVPLAPGDVVVLSPDCEHVLQDSLGSRVVAIDELFEAADTQRRPLPVYEDEGIRTTLLGGVFEFDELRVHPFYSVLPPVVHLREQETAHASHLRELIHLIDRESTGNQPGGRGIVYRLVESLMALAVRKYLIAANGTSRQTLEGALHPSLNAALALIHRHPERPWTVGELADQAAMSRSAFAASFQKVLGKPPLQYVRKHRMQLACRLLHNPTLGLKEIASQVGYDSLSAFCTAFKRHAGMSPGDYRRREIPSEAARMTAAR